MFELWDLRPVAGRFFISNSTTSQPYGAILGASLLPRELPELWPASGVVATALMSTPVLRHFINYLGVREAGTETILQMFADGYKVTGNAGTIDLINRYELAEAYIDLPATY